MVDWATVIVGGRLSSYKADTMELAASGTISRSTLDAYGEFTPYAGLIVDVTDDLSVYASYADIFQPQTGTTAAGALLAPRVGEQYEIGVKGEFLDDKLLTHMAVFQIEDMNRAITDPNNAGSSLAAGLVRTRGFEAEVSGEVAPGWNVFGGYSYALATFLEDTTRKGNVFNSRFSPKDSFKLWTRYAFQQPELRGFSVGGGVKYFGRLVNHPVERPGYVTADVQTGYALNNNLSATFTVTNVFDKEYYSAIDSTAGFNQVGEPRAFMLGLRATW
jgi:outer membrane receptor for ferric coprogen and ferric-rhodotorulic acid